MVTAFLILLVIALSVVCGFSIFFAIRWAKIIMLLEDDLAEAVEVHERSVATLERVLATPLFFDSPEVKPMLTEALADIKVCKIATQKLVRSFTQRSKQKYVRIEQREEVEE